MAGRKGDTDQTAPQICKRKKTKLKHKTNGFCHPASKAAPVRSGDRWHGRMPGTEGDGAAVRPCRFFGGAREGDVGTWRVRSLSVRLSVYLFVGTGWGRVWRGNFIFHLGLWFVRRLSYPLPLPCSPQQSVVGTSINRVRDAFGLGFDRRFPVLKW